MSIPSLFLPSIVLLFGLTTVKSHNVVLIVADDLNRRISPLGDPDAITPNLDRLARKSIVFTNGVCQNPLCCPSRASFLTGLHPWDIGIKKGGSGGIKVSEIIPNRLLIQEYFAKAGYWTASFGKVEHVLEPKRWSESSGKLTSTFPPAKVVSSRNFSAYSNVNGDSEFTVYDAPPEKFADGEHATRAIAALQARARDRKPFFIAVGFQKPHTPWRVPQSITRLYDPKKFTLPKDPPKSFERWPSWTFPDGKADKRPVMDDETKRQLLHAYYSAVTLMDSQLGRILDTMDSHQMWKDTIVMFVSDNGFNLMEHRLMYAKKRITRESVSVPMMVAAPGKPSHEKCHRQVGLVDIFPTLTDLAGLPPYGKHLAGHSLVPLIEKPSLGWSHIQFSNTVLTSPKNTHVTARIAQFGQWKLVESNSGNGLKWIINHQSDTFEHFPVRARVRALGIRRETFLRMEKALDDEIPLSAGVYFKTPTKPPFDRDGDSLSTEQEIELRGLGFRTFIDDSKAIEKRKLQKEPRPQTATDGSK